MDLNKFEDLTAIKFATFLECSLLSRGRNKTAA